MTKSTLQFIEIPTKKKTQYWESDILCLYVIFAWCVEYLHFIIKSRWFIENYIQIINNVKKQLSNIAHSSQSTHINQRIRQCSKVKQKNAIRLFAVVLQITKMEQLFAISTLVCTYSGKTLCSGQVRLSTFVQIVVQHNRVLFVQPQPLIMSESRSSYTTHTCLENESNRLHWTVLLYALVIFIEYAASNKFTICSQISNELVNWRNF